ncbi:MAG: adenine phosphoribosyltransferase [Thermococci archaeon]|nr:adenine phosphoribosyltransferase [Thermococci archaeon]
MSQLKSVRRKLRIIHLLRLLKRRYTYEELSKITGLPVTVLNRYVKGKVLPSSGRTLQLSSILDPYVDLEKEVRDRLIFDSRGFFDIMPALGSTDLMTLVAEKVAADFESVGVDKVLTAATDGIPLAVHVGRELGVDVVYAKKRKEVGTEKFHEVSYVPSASGSVTTLYIPHWALKKSDKVLIVDDVIRSGETQRALVELCHKAGARPVGMFFLVSVGDVVSTLEGEYKIPVRSLVKL